MRIEDMAKWTVDELKAEVVRLSEECEKNSMRFWIKMIELMNFNLNWIKCVIIMMS